MTKSGLQGHPKRLNHSLPLLRQDKNPFQPPSLSLLKLSIRHPKPKERVVDANTDTNGSRDSMARSPGGSSLLKKSGAGPSGAKLNSGLPPNVGSPVPLVLRGALLLGRVGLEKAKVRRKGRVVVLLLPNSGWGPLCSVRGGKQLPPRLCPLRVAPSGWPVP